MHSGMIVSEFPLESVPASVELRVSLPLNVSTPLLITDFFKWSYAPSETLCTVLLFFFRASLTAYLE